MKRKAFRDWPFTRVSVAQRNKKKLFFLSRDGMLDSMLDHHRLPTTTPLPSVFCQVAPAVCQYPLILRSGGTARFQCLAKEHNDDPGQYLNPDRANSECKLGFIHLLITVHTFLICIVCLIMIHSKVNNIITILDLLSFVAHSFCLLFSAPLFCNDFSLSFFSLPF